jgi:hypothetical protein
VNRGQDAARPADAGATEIGASDARESGSGDGRTPADHSPLALCGYPDFVPCGGSLLGTWRHWEFCDFRGEPASRPRECLGPGEQEPTCQGVGNVRQCQTLYEGTIELQAAQLHVAMTVAVATRYTFTDRCLGAIGAAGSTVAEACRLLSGPVIKCEHRFGECTCQGTSEPIAIDASSFGYTVDGTRLTIRGPDRTATGSFCVRDNRLTISFDGPYGFEGWAGWSLER